MVVIIGIILMLSSIVIITLRFGLRKSGRKKMLRVLVVSWIACLIIGAALMAIDEVEHYVPANKIYKGYWYNANTGQHIRDEYEFKGGEGIHPVAALIFYPFMFAAVGVVYGSSIVVAKEKASKAVSIPSKIFVFFGHGWLGTMSLGIYPLCVISQEHFLAKQQSAQENTL